MVMLLALTLELLLVVELDGSSVMLLGNLKARFRSHFYKQTCILRYIRDLSNLLFRHRWSYDSARF